MWWIMSWRKRHAMSPQSVGTQCEQRGNLHSVSNIIPSPNFKCLFTIVRSYSIPPLIRQRAHSRHDKLVTFCQKVLHNRLCCHCNRKLQERFIEVTRFGAKWEENIFVYANEVMCVDTRTCHGRSLVLSEAGSWCYVHTHAKMIVVE